MNRLQHYLDRPDYGFVYSIGKMAYVASTIVKNGIFAFVFIMAIGDPAHVSSSDYGL